MRIASWMKRLLALFLSLCTIVGLLPAVGFFALEADAAITDEISALVSELTAAYGDFKIPKTKAKYVTNSTVGNLDGTYFMIIMARDKGAASQHRMINFDGWPATRYDRLSENCYSGTPGSDKVMYLPSAWITVGSWGTGNDTFEYINNQNPANLLDYAVEFKRYTKTINYNTNQYFNEGSKEGETGYGWEEYTNWEYKRDNWATSGNSTYVGFGPYLKIATIHSKSDIAYSIKSLHPAHASAPYLGTTDAYGAVGYLSDEAPFFMKVNADTKTFKIYKIDQNGGNFHTYWLGIDNNYNADNRPINAHTISQIVREDKNQNTGDYPGNYDNQYTMDWELIQVSPYTLELYKALYKAKSYVTGGQGSYPAETYLGFLKYVKTAMADYKANYQTFNDDKNNSERTRMDSEAKDLTSYTALLDIEKDSESYMDIPVEILDFRADGLLFEGLNNGSTAYSMAVGSTGFDTIARPGTPGTGDNGQSYLAGLIEPQLKKGRIVYKQETIQYIATALYKQHHTFADKSISGYDASDFDSAWNNVFMSRVSGSSMPMGDWENTKTKIQGGENGGVMLYSSVETCYDLAYYMLTNIWRETASDDIVDSARNLTYNTKVTELDTLRLIKGSDGKFYFRSELVNGRNLDSGLIYNYPNNNTAQEKHPNMNAIADLGFEKILGSNTTGSSADNQTHIFGRKNYHVMYHVQSAFIYYESKDLSFTFSGDDDVYFFINGELVRDLGGLHPAASCTFSLNGEVAKNLGLKDGDICTFDMFLTDRHIDGVNLNLVTNIEMMPVGTVTEKVQYYYTGTGLPETEIREGAAVPDGTEVGYGFKLLNRGKHGVQNVSFTDKNLGATISHSKVELGGYGTPEQLTMILRSYDPLTGELSNAAAQTKTYSDMYIAITNANKNMSTATPLKDVVYRADGLGKYEIMVLLEKGLPANTQMEIYGLHRTVNAATGTYSNTVYTSCDPIIGMENNEFVLGESIVGSARRNLVARSVDIVHADRYTVVLDYGKPVEFTVGDFLSTLTYNKQATTVSFMGIRLDRAHGATDLFRPSYMYLEKDDDTLTTENGTYKRTGDTIRFTPNGFMEGVDCLYGIVSVTNSSVGIWYLAVAIDVLPANMVYYEAESLVGTEVQTLKKDETGSVTWNDPVSDDVQQTERVTQDLDATKNDNIQLSQKQEFIPDDAFFVDFDGTGYKERYGHQPQYGGYDFDKKENWSVFVYSSGATDTKIVAVDTVAGTLTFEDNMTKDSAGNAVDWNYIHTGTGAGSQVLRYAPGDHDYMQIRMKLENGTVTNGKSFNLSLEVNDGTSAKYMGSKSFSAAEYMDGNFHIFTVPLNHSEYGGTLTYVRPIIHGTQGCRFTVDYIYVGPEQGLPENLYMDYLFFNFTDFNTEARRYQGNAYGGVNFDKPAAWGAPTDTNGIQMSGGYLILEDKNTEANVRWDYIETQSSTTNLPLSYHITQNDVLQVRLKIDGGTENPTYKPQVRVEFLVDSSNLKHAGHVEFNYNNTSRPDLMTVYSGQYYTITIPLNDGEYVSRDILQSIRFVIYNIENEVTTIDYIYLGPEQFLSEIHKSQDYMLFDFAETTAEALRLSRAVYGNSTFDFRKVEYWATDSSTTINSVNGTEGTITFTDTSTTANYNFIQPGDGYGSWTLNYKPKANDYMQVRMKITQGATQNSKVAVRLECNKGNGVLVYGEVTFSSAYMDGQYHVFTVPLTGGPYQSLVSSNGVLDGFRLVLTGAEGVTYTVDYIYIGPLKESVLPGESLCFGFENSAQDQNRYSNETYSGINFDRWDGNATANKANWATAYGPSASATDANGSGTDFIMDNRIGTLTVYPGSTVSYDDHKIYRVDLQPAATYGNFLYSKDVGDLLRYRANGGDVIRIRLRVENCVDGSVEDGYIGADGWNEAQGDLLDTPRVEVRVDYRQSGVQKTVAPNAYTANIDVDNEGFQILTIPVGDYLANADFVECITLRFFHIKNNGNGKIVVDYIYMGPGDANREPVYGYDSGYTNDGKLSDGKSLYVEGNGVKLSDTTVKYTETTFSFAGTGFDLVSRTGKDQATIRVAVYDDPSMTEEHRIKSLTVNNKGELELYQIPVVSVQGLKHGTYYVAVWVNDKVTAAGLPQLPGVDLSSLTRGNEFYLDAIRIYDPIDVSGGTLTTDQAVALNAYKADKEAYQYIKEVRNILLSKDAFDNLSGTIDGAVFVDTEKMSAATETSPEGIGVENHITASIKTYDKIGPKNEVYLAPGQAVAFRLAIDTNIPVDSLDIGAKTVVAGGKAKLTVGFVVDNKTVEGKTAYNVQSATAQYHAVYGECIRFLTSGSTKEVYIVLYNDGDANSDNNVLSITDVKVAYRSMPTITPLSDNSSDSEIVKKGAWAEVSPVRFLIDGNATRAVETFVQADCDLPFEEETPEEDEPVTEPENGGIAEGITIRHSLDLASDISLNYAVAKTELEGYENIAMLCTIPVYEGNALVGTRELVLSPDEKGAYYYFTLTGLTAVHMNDMVEATLSMTKDGIAYTSRTDTYSVARYAYGQLSKTGISRELQKLCAELLRYGGAAQIYKGYRTDALADEAMTEEELELLTDMDAVSFDSYNTVTGNVPDSGVSWAGKSLLLDSKVAIRYILNLSNYTGEIGDLTLVLTYESLDGEEKTVTLENPVLYNEKLGYYSLDFDGLLAAELRQPVRATAYCGEKAVTGTLEYSASTYGNNKTGELGDLCKCLMSYSDSAKAYFTK